MPQARIITRFPQDASGVAQYFTSHGYDVETEDPMEPRGSAVADIEVDRESGEIRVTHLYGALDAGLAVNPALVENQIEGMLIQATGRALIEEVQFTKTNVTSLDWKTYPVLRFADHPRVTPIVVQRLDERSTGAGEEVMGAAVGAIANAFFDATGARVREYPMTPDRVRAALKA